MKKIFLTLLILLPVALFAQFSNQKVITGTLHTNSTITSDTSYIFNVGGKSFRWSFISSWDTSVIAGKSYVKAQLSNDGTHWADISGEIGHTIDTAALDNQCIAIWGSSIPAEYLRYLIHRGTGDTLRYFNLKYIFKQ